MKHGARAVLDVLIPLSRPSIGAAEEFAVAEVLHSGMLAQGPKTAELEDRFCEVVGTRFAVAVSSGTTALYLALLAHGIGAGDEVITTPFTFIATANSILLTGARPVFADIDEGTFNLSPQAVEAAITNRTKAIMPVHLYGRPCDLDAFVGIARRHELILIEDAAQALGARLGDRSVGSFGTGIFSLYATKNVTAAEGGIITSHDPAIAARLRLLRNHGMRTRYHYEMLGFNARMSDLHAAIAIAQMDRLSDFVAQRRANAEFLSRHIHTVITPQNTIGAQHAWHQYTVRAKDANTRNAAVARLTKAGVGTGIFYPVALHRQPHIDKLIGEVHLPVSEQMAGQVFSLPVHPSLSKDELRIIVSEVNKLGLSCTDQTLSS